MSIGRHRPPDAPARPSSGRKRGRFNSGFASLRDALSFIAGMVIIGNEVFISDEVEIYAIGVGIALAGLPVVFGADERGKSPPP